jgi:hypothetical protein
VERALFSPFLQRKQCSFVLVTNGFSEGIPLVTRSEPGPTFREITSINQAKVFQFTRCQWKKPHQKGHGLSENRRFSSFRSNFPPSVQNRSTFQLIYHESHKVQPRAPRGSGSGAPERAGDGLRGAAGMSSRSHPRRSWMADGKTSHRK